ncbi:MAG: glutaredoxin [bacterium]|nr:glutaredoxin [bacterium]
MKITMYGAAICPDCVVAKQQLSTKQDVELEYKDITSTTATLKEFLKFRDFEPMFEQVKNDGKIGIPFFVLEDGTKTFDIETYVAFDPNLERPVNACSIDGKNC